MKQRIYGNLVNRVPGIASRYHAVHDGSAGLQKVFSWIYLLWLNFCYYILFCRFLGKVPQMEVYEKARLLTAQSESAAYIKENPDLSVEKYVEKLEQYDTISFDIFDTLIFRPLSFPTDAFFLMGEKLGYMDFKNVRIQAEQWARHVCMCRVGNAEVTLEEIWVEMEKETGIPKEKGIAVEEEIELAICYANPFMRKVWERLRQKGKRLLVISDMYLSKKCLTRMLEQAGYTGAENVYVSCEYKKSKAAGTLFQTVKKDYPKEKIIHVGDNPHSDGAMAQANGFFVCPYPNSNRWANLYRAFDMSFMVGSAYRGIVSNHLYSGLQSYDMEYEYGFIYGGLFALGYCAFIHDYCRKNQMDKVLFLSRDGDILKQVYDRIYPEDSTAYVYWSRKCATKLMADEDKHDFFRRFINHKVNQDYTIREILTSMDLEALLDELGDWKKIWMQHEMEIEQGNKDYRKAYFALIGEEDDATEESEEKVLLAREKSYRKLKPEDKLTDQNAWLLRIYIEGKWTRVKEIYEEQQRAAAAYYRQILKGCAKAAAVDIGWAGSGAVALGHLVGKVWNIPCEIVGIIAGTNTLHNAEPAASETFLQSGRLVSYLYSQSHNRDLMKRHDPNKDYNVFWELLLSSPTPQFGGFYGKPCEEKADVKDAGENEQPACSRREMKLENGQKIWLEFGKYDKNKKGICQIQQGILDFAEEYRTHFGQFPYMFTISGRDAYAPMVLASSYKERYLKAIEEKFALEINVN